MTNAEIITDARLQLMKQGLIGTTGRIFTVVTVDKDGVEETRDLPEPEEIHTFQRWKELGYSVKKGEHAVAHIGIWKYAKGVKEDENGEEIDNSKMLRTIACFFSASQVQPMGVTE